MKKVIKNAKFANINSTAIFIVIKFGTQLTIVFMHLYKLNINNLKFNLSYLTYGWR